MEEERVVEEEEKEEVEKSKVQEEEVEEDKTYRFRAPLVLFILGIVVWKDPSFRYSQQENYSLLIC